ncbi:hypothetical protein CNO18_11120 [Gordonia sp. 1D]|nr:hypothetical protein CNO18_11120 [Gordonia sp. 1D]
MGARVTRKLSDRFELKRVGDLKDTFVLAHGQTSWLDFPESHLGDLLRIIQGEINRRHNGENKDEN